MPRVRAKSRRSENHASGAFSLEDTGVGGGVLRDFLGAEVDDGVDEVLAQEHSADGPPVRGGLAQEQADRLERRFDGQRWIAHAPHFHQVLPLYALHRCPRATPSPSTPSPVAGSPQLCDVSRKKHWDLQSPSNSGCEQQTKRLLGQSTTRAPHFALRRSNPNLNDKKVGSVRRKRDVRCIVDVPRCV